MQFKTPILLLAGLLALSLTSVSSHAITFDYSYTFGSGVVVSGSLDGDLNGQFVENVSNVSVFFDGTPMPGTIFSAHHTGFVWVNGGPIFSFDVFQNNFRFINSDFLNGDNSYNSFFEILFGVAAAESALVGFTVDNPPLQANWSLTARSTSSVPDLGATLPLFSAALAGLAWFNRRRRH